MIPAYVIERLFWQERGMTVGLVVYTEIIYAVTVTLAEVPSGVLADRFGRKKTLIIWGFLCAAEIAILFFARSFFMFAAAVFLAGVGRALASGSDNALMYDSLAAEGRAGDFEKINGRMSAVEYAGATLAALSGGVLANLFGFEFNYIVSFVSLIIAFAVILTLREPPYVKRGQPDGAGAKPAGLSLRAYATEALGVFGKYPLLTLYCLTGAVVGSCFIHLDEFWQLIMDSIETPVIFFGVIGAALSAVSVPGKLLAYRLKDKPGCGVVLPFVLLISAAGYFAVYMTRNILCLIPIVIVYVSAGAADPLVAGYLHGRAESGVRATVESFQSIGFRAVSACVGLAFGFVCSLGDIFTGFVALGVLCVVCLAAYIAAAMRLGAFDNGAGGG